MGGLGAPKPFKNLPLVFAAMRSAHHVLLIWGLAEEPAHPNKYLDWFRVIYWERAGLQFQEKGLGLWGLRVWGLKGLRG